MSRRQRRAPRSPRSSSHPPSRRSHPSRIGIAGLALVLTAAAGWAYATSFRGVFVLDDQFGIADNPNIKTLWPLTKAMSAPPELPVSARPVASLTLAINYALAPEDVRDVLTSGGPGATPERHDQYLRNVWGYHFLNLTLHVLAGLSLFGVLRRTFRSGRLAARFAAHATALAFAITLLWIVHPLLTDAVTYVVQRTEVLMGLFYLSTLYCAIRAAEPDLPLRVRRSWMVGSVVSCALGMGSKQTMVTAPLMVWLWDWTFVSDVPSRQDDRARGDRRYLYAGLAATWGILGALVAMERWPHSIGLNREGWTPWTYLLTQSGVIVHYLRLAFVPSPLALDYDGWPMARSVVDIAPHGALLLILLAATVVAIVRRHPAGFLGGWFFALLAPSSSVLPLATEIAAERRMYLPLAAIITAVVAAVYLLGRRASGSLIADPRLRAVAGTAAAVALLGSVAVVLGAATAARNRDYWSDERIWADTVAKRPGNSRARVNYGVDLYAAGRLREAEQQLREAVRLKETSAPAHANLGPVLCALGQLDEGIAHLERALELDPEYSAAHGNLGEAYAAQGRRALAAHQFALAVERAPDNPFFLNRLGWLLATSPEDAVRNGARAVAVAERAASITSRRDMMSLETLSAAYAEAGRFPEAVATVREALALAERQGNRAIVPDLTNRLALFEAGRKYREPS